VLEPTELQRLRQEKRECFLVYYAAARLQGLRVPEFRFLPEETQADILCIWRSYKAARTEGERFLFSLGDAEQVQHAARNAPVGKFVGDSLYVHRSAEDRLLPLSRIQIFAARQIVGQQEYDLVKLSADGRKVSFLKYPGFDTIAHPALASSVSVYLPKADYGYRDFSSSENPPILHRKDSLVDETYPLYDKFAALSRQEEKCSLLSRPDIGQREGWNRILAELGLRICGHRVLRQKSAPGLDRALVGAK
jgi:DNA phosphorothioation-associated putative methyltransferase